METQPHVAAAIVQAPGEASGFFPGYVASHAARTPCRSSDSGIGSTVVVLLGRRGAVLRRSAASTLRAGHFR